ncbi:hypothetical protein M8494_27875 [Serratia ureilytica]
MNFEHDRRQDAAGEPSLAEADRQGHRYSGQESRRLPAVGGGRTHRSR